MHALVQSLTVFGCVRNIAYYGVVLCVQQSLFVEARQASISNGVQECVAALSPCFLPHHPAHRPPGHHAQREVGGGYCIFNNVAVAAHHALAHHQLQRVAIVDFDVHHGNGTQVSEEAAGEEMHDGSRRLWKQSKGL